MKLGIVGVRHEHIMNLIRWAGSQPDVELCAAWENDAGARAEAEARGIRFTHSTLEALLAEDTLDAVAVGDYFGARGADILMALRAGKHVLSDKPICTDLAMVGEIRRLAEERALCVGCMLDLRFHPSFRAATRIVREGKIGRVHNAVFTGTHPLMWGTRPGWYAQPVQHGGTLNDIAVHGVDVLRRMTGARLKRVVGARCWNAYATEAPQFRDSAQFVYALDNGVGICGDVSYSAPPWTPQPLPQYWRMTVWGEQGVVECAAALDAAQLILHDGKAPQSIPDTLPPSDPLREFVRVVRGEQGDMETAGVLDSAEDTLRLQLAADL